jgi:thioredoxin-dependent peroxiredoxin
VRDEQTEYAAKGVTTLGVNPAAVESHERYADKFRFPFPLLSDADRAVARAYHALKENGRSIHRTVYLVGTDRRIRFGQRGAPAVDSILASLE